MADEPKRTITPRTGPDAGKARTVDHEKGLVDSVKGMIASHASTSGNQKEASALDALEGGVNDAPGNSTDY